MLEKGTRCWELYQNGYVNLDKCHFNLASTALDYTAPVIPPLTEINCAVIHRLFSETRRSAASAISSVDPRRSAARVFSYSER
jgi:hypothetical protein